MRRRVEILSFFYMYGIHNIFITSKEQLNNYVSDEEIMTFYFGDFELNKFYLSPFRSERTPSFMITYYKNNLVYRDFGVSNIPYGVIDFVRNIKLPIKNYSYLETLGVIYKEIVLSNKIPKLETTYVKPEKVSHHLVMVKGWEKYQLEYWSRGGISEKTLDYFNVHWCKSLWYGDKAWTVASKNNLTYVYDHSLHALDESWTVYRPNAPYDKRFRKYNIDGRVLGLDLIPERGELLVITKSYKDIMVLYELGVPAIAPHNENIPISKEIIEDLKKRFYKIYVNYDNDSTGVKSSIHFTKEYGLYYWNLPKDLNCKDPFDCSCKYGIEKVFDNLNEKIQRDERLGNTIGNTQKIQ